LRYFYTILFYLALPYSFLRLLWRSRKQKAYRQHWGERLGFCPLKFEQSIWIHAASVGETIAAIPLIKALQLQYPALPIIVTNMTITGRARTQAAFGDTVYKAFIPYDVPSAVNRFLGRVNPIVAVILETELWPNLFAACKTRHIPIVVANARLSEKSAAGYHKVSAITQEMLLNIHTLAVQTQIEADRFQVLGLPPERAVVTGNIKFDLEIPGDLLSKRDALRAELGIDRLIWVAASTHATEEDIVLAAHKAICAKYPDALLILVPRHPDRFESIFALCQQQGFEAVRRAQGEKCKATTQVYLADTMGEMLLMYAVCDVAFVAGSFAAVGGHNMLEAAVLGKPVVTGEILFNFAEISRSLIAAKGMITVKDQIGLQNAIITLFADRNYRQTMGENGKRFVDANRGALQKQLQLIQVAINSSRFKSA